jgi:nucleoside-diphosphate-sugar epimerase
MENKKLIIVGKNSFIGSNIYQSLNKTKKIKIVSLKQFLKLKNHIIDSYEYICNCSDNKKKLNQKYKKANDFDLIILKKIKDLDIKYILLSTRRVYLPKFNIKENSKIKSLDIYSSNKLKTEKILKKKIKSRLLILRVSNIIGIKKNKKYRKVHKTFFDNYIDIIKSNKKIKYVNLFKDFLSIDQFVKIFNIILEKKIIGTYNLSLGKKIYISEIISWLNFYSQKKNKLFKKTNNALIQAKNSFTLNNEKLIKKIKYKPSKIELKNYCINLSKRIH